MKKIPIWKNVILILSVVVVIIIAAFAWFVFDTEGTADQIAVRVGSATYIQISGGNGNQWSDDLIHATGINMDFKETSGNGTNFFTPVYEVLGSDKDNVSSEGYYTALTSFKKLEDANKSEYYYEEILKFGSDVEQEIYLDPLSYIIPADPEDETGIHGAIRIAFFELGADGSENLRYVWAPNSEVVYTADEEDPFATSDVSEDFYCYQVGTALSQVSAQIPTAGELSGYNQERKFMWSNATVVNEENGQNLPENAPYAVKIDLPIANAAQSIAAIESDKNKEINFYKEMKVKVWLEGTDRECVSLLDGQRFTIKLQFKAMEANNDE